MASISDPPGVAEGSRPETTTGGPPVFLLGFPRSGTTLLRLCLDAHPGLAIPFESFVLLSFYRRVGEYGDLRTLSNRDRLIDDLLGAKGIRAWSPRVTKDQIDLSCCTTYPGVVDQIFRAYARSCGKARWGDKTPSYTGHIHLLNELFPEAQFVHLIRDGRDVALSLMRQPWGPGDYVTSLTQWNEVVGWSRRMGRLLSSGRYVEVRYEDLVSRPEQTLRHVATFLGLSFTAAMLDSHLTAREKLPMRSLAFHERLVRPPDGRLAFQWERVLSRADRAIALQIARPLLADLEYPADPIHIPHWRVHARRLVLWARAALRWRVRRVRKRARRVVGGRHPESRLKPENGFTTPHASSQRSIE